MYKVNILYVVSGVKPVPLSDRHLNLEHMLGDDSLSECEMSKRRPRNVRIFGYLNVRMFGCTNRFKDENFVSQLATQMEALRGRELPGFMSSQVHYTDYRLE